MANTYTLIASSTLGAGGSTNITFSSIPSTYTDLILKISGRVTETGGVQDIAIQYNNDTGSNYQYKELVGTGSSTSSSTSTTTRHNTIGNANDTTASTFSNIEIYIPNYTDSNQKLSSADAVVENNSPSTSTQLRLQAWKWSGTAAISTIKVYDPAGGNLVQYSSAYLYGIKNS